MAKADRRSYPLRKVMYNEDYKDYLECGHILPIAQDIIGYRYPERRRCHKCAKGKDADYVVNGQSNQ